MPNLGAMKNMIRDTKSSQHRTFSIVASTRALVVAAACLLFVSALFGGVMAEEATDDATRAHAAGDYAAAAAIWQAAAADGDAAAQFNLGLLFESGLGVEQDIVAAARWYRRAAVNGIGAAQHNLAALIVADRPAEALFWLEILAASGDEALAVTASQAATLVAGSIPPDIVKAARARAADWIGEKPDAADNGLMMTLRHSVPLVSLSDDQVKAMQRRLGKLGYDVGPVDGIIGKRSRESLADWRRDNGLDPEERRVPMELISGN